MDRAFVIRNVQGQGDNPVQKYQCQYSAGQCDQTAQDVIHSVIPARGQVSENSANPPNKDTWDVLHDDESRSYLANNSGVL